MAAAEKQSREPAMEIAEGLLKADGPTVTKEQIDFASSPIPEYKPFNAVVLDNVFSQEECDALLNAAESSGPYERAMVNIGGGKQRMDTYTRNCGRVIFDTRNLAAAIWARVEPHVQEILRLDDHKNVTGAGPVRRKEVWKFVRLNERLRFLKYEGGEYFPPHCDGMYETPDKKERSYFTLHLYLNDCNAPSPERRLLSGGATTFHTFFGEDEPRLDVQPKVGRVLIFQQAHLVHSGDDVVAGQKFTMRTDMMYEKQ